MAGPGHGGPALLLLYGARTGTTTDDCRCECREWWPSFIQLPGDHLGEESRVD